jgi:hypothetical protein
VHQLSDMQIDVLLRIADDVEAPHTIAADLTRDLGRPVAESEVLVVLLELVRLGAASAFEYSHSTQRYEPLEAMHASSAPDPWFRAKREAVAQLAPPRA